MKSFWISTTLAVVLAIQLTGCVPLVAAGAGAGLAVATDRRTSATYMADEEIQLRAANRVSAVYADNQKVHVNFNSYNRSLLLTGEVPDQATKSRIEQLVRDVPDLNGLHNELQIAPPESFKARSDDVYLSATIHTRFINAKTVPDATIKVVVEEKVVYLMGFVTHKEGDDAVYVARATNGVARVVSLFDYQ